MVNPKRNAGIAAGFKFIPAEGGIRAEPDSSIPVVKEKSRPTTQNLLKRAFSTSPLWRRPVTRFATVQPLRLCASASGIDKKGLRPPPNLNPKQMAQPQAALCCSPAERAKPQHLREQLPSQLWF